MLALQFLVKGARDYNESDLFISFDESGAEIIADSAGLELICDLAAALPAVVLGDALRLRQPDQDDLVLQVEDTGIHVESRPGIGSCFAVRIPLRAQPDPFPGRTGGSPGRSGAGATSALPRDPARILEKAGHQVTVAETANRPWR